MAKVVADDGVVHGLRRSAAVRVRRDYDPARDTGGARGDVARDLISCKLHAPRAQKRDPDPREVPVELRGSTRVRVVPYSVACHLEVTHGFGFEGFEEHARAVVADFVSEDGAAVGVGDEDAPRAARDVVADNLRVLGFLACQVSPNIPDTAHIIGEDLGPGRVDDFRADPGGYEVIILDGGVGALEKNIDRGLASGVALDDIVHDFGVKGAIRNKDGRGIALGVPIRSLSATLALMPPLTTTPPATLPTVRFPVTVASRVPIRSIVNAGSSSGVSAWKPRIVKPLTLTSLTRFLTSKVSRFTSPKTQMASGPKALEQGESALAGASITASSPRSFIPSLRITTSSRWTPRTTMVSPGSAALIAFWMDSPGPTTALCAPAEPTPAARVIPLAISRGSAMVANTGMVRLIGRPAFLGKGAG